jgi:hypothetical protein
MILDTINKYKGVDRPGLKRLTCVSFSSRDQKLRFSLSLIPMRDQKRCIPSPMKLHFSYDESLKAYKNQKKHPKQNREKREQKTKGNK